MMPPLFVWQEAFEGTEDKSGDETLSVEEMAVEDLCF